MVSLAIIIVNFKTPQLVIDCLESLVPELRVLDAKVIIVDNASNDNSCGLIQCWINEQSVSEKVVLMTSAENTGFSGGNNRGIRHIDAEYYLLLNSDTVLRRGAVSKLISACIEDDNAGLISPRLEWPDATPQESCFRFHSPLSELISAANSGPVTSLLQNFNVPYPVRNKQEYYDWTSFACVLIKAEVFKDVGLMDDGYFMYYEDVAFAFNAQRSGWKVLNVPDAHVVHLRGGSSPVKSQAKQCKRLPRYFYESRTRYYYQVYGRTGLLLANLCWLLGYCLAIVRSFFSSSFQPNVPAKQWRDIWTNFLTPLKAYIHPDNYDQA